MTTKYVAVYGFSRYTQPADQLRMVIPEHLATSREQAEEAAAEHGEASDLILVRVEEETS